MDYIFLIGRILFGGYFLMNAWMHFSKIKGYAGYTASKGVPYPIAAVLITGLLLFIGGLGILLGIYIPLAVTSLILFFVPVTFTMHAFWKSADPTLQMNERIHFWKNIGLLGGALLLLSIPEPWAFSLSNIIH